jgi:hypothetical protein
MSKKLPEDHKSFEEIIIEYPMKQRKLYDKNDEKCIYPIWPSKVGIHKAGGNFPAMVAREYFEDLGYIVLPQYYLVRCPKQRKSNEGFKLICKIFSKQRVSKVLDASKAINLKGGDPDLFVYKKNFTEGFFVEVKEKDKLSTNQLSLIPIIEKYLCPVLIARVKPIN